MTPNLFWRWRKTQWGIVHQSASVARLVLWHHHGHRCVGGGIVMDGKIWNGRHGIAGEWGHNFLDASGRSLLLW